MAESHLELNKSTEVSDTEHNGAAISVEHLLIVIIGLTAFFLRFRGLASPLLSNTEANEALAIWRLMQAGVTDVFPNSPIYFLLTAIVVPIFGLSDATVRFVPALFGSMLVILPCFLRHRIGNIGVLIASLLLAVSPLLVVSARMAGGISIATFAGLMIFISWLRYQETSSKRWLNSLVATAVLGILAHSLIYSFLFALILAWLIQRLIGPALVQNEHGERKAAAFPEKTTVRYILYLAAILFILGGSAIFLVPNGIGAAAELTASWFQAFHSLFDFERVSKTLSLVLYFEIGLVVLGLPAAIWAARKDYAFPIFMVYWAVSAIFLILLQAGSMFNLIVLLVPGYLLIGVFINGQFSNKISPVAIGTTVVVLVAGMIAVSNLVRFSRLANPDNLDLASYYGLLVAVSIIIGILLVALAWSFNRKDAVAGISLGILLMLVFYGWGNASWLAITGYNDSRIGLVDVAADDDLVSIRDQLVELSWRITNSPDGIVIVSTIDSPNLRWYFRDFYNLTYSGTVPRTIDNHIVIAKSDELPALPADYVGTDFGHLRRAGPHPIDNIYQGLRWWLFHDSTWPIDVETATLWLRADAIRSQES